jgi:hypothetical protein
MRLACWRSAGVTSSRGLPHISLAADVKMSPPVRSTWTPHTHTAGRCIPINHPSQWGPGGALGPGKRGDTAPHTCLTHPRVLGQVGGDAHLNLPPVTINHVNVNANERRLGFLKHYQKSRRYTKP